MRLFEREKIGSILVNLRVLSPQQVERILHALRQRRDQTKFGQVAKEMGLVREEHIMAALAVQMQLFPGVRDMSLRHVLSRLSDPGPAVPLGK